MNCEVCGRRIIGKPYKAIIEKARLVVCKDCATLGSISWELKTPKPSKPVTRKPREQLRQPKTQKRQSAFEPALELVADFGTRIRRARESHGFSHEDLGKRINEKISVIRRLESQKMKPNTKLAEKLQHALKIQLLAQVTEEKPPKGLLAAEPPARSFTLGDLMKSKEESEATE